MILVRESFFESLRKVQYIYVIILSRKVCVEDKVFRIIRYYFPVK